MLNVGLGEQLREGGGVMRIHCCHVPVEKRASDGLGITRWRTVSGRESNMAGCSEHYRAQSPESKQTAPVLHVCALLRCQCYIALLCLVSLCVKAVDLALPRLSRVSKPSAVHDQRGSRMTAVGFDANSPLAKSAGYRWFTCRP